MRDVKKHDIAALNEENKSVTSQTKSAELNLPSERNSGTEYAHPIISTGNLVGEVHPLHIKIERSPSEHVRFVASGGEINSIQLSHKRTLIVIGLLLAKKLAITPVSFCKLFYGKAGSHPSARFGDSIINVGLRPYRTKKPPYQFPQVTFDWTDISEDELKTYLTETARQ